MFLLTKVLFVASESAPFIKSGGLGEVVYALVSQMRKENIDARIMIPKYSDIYFHYKNKMKKLTALYVNVGWRRQYCGIEYLEYEGIPVYFIDNEYYFKRSGLYGYYDEAERFAFFNRAVLESIPQIDFVPDIIHCNDWHAGALPFLLKTCYENLNTIKTVFTIHNLYYQGIFPKEILGDLFGLSESSVDFSSIEFFGGMSFMKAAISYSDIITTVSRAYANEIQTPMFGEKLDGFLRTKGDRIYGIQNGIDYSIYNPKEDKLIFQNYDENTINQKQVNKIRLQKQLDLQVDEDKPLLGIVSRLVKQKGIDLLLTKIDELMNEDIQLIILGSGEKYYEEMLYAIQNKYNNKMSVNIKFDDSLAHKIYAASDIFLMPSLFEPCGLGQMVALKYGTIPVVRETGGLKDTIDAYNEFANEGNGFSFKNYNQDEFINCIRYALKFYSDKRVWNDLMKRAMKCDNSWEKSTVEYLNLYKKLRR